MRREAKFCKETRRSVLFCLSDALMKNSLLPFCHFGSLPNTQNIIFRHIHITHTPMLKVCYSVEESGICNIGTARLTVSHTPLILPRCASIFCEQSETEVWWGKKSVRKTWIKSHILMQSHILMHTERQNWDSTGKHKTNNSYLWSAWLCYLNALL